MTNDSRLGSKIATLRDSLGLSVEQLAERCACEVSVIEKLEAGEVAPSLAPLIRITRALGVRLGTLLDDDANVGPVVTRAADAREGARLHGLETGSAAGTLDFSPLAEGKTSRHMEPFLITVNPAVERALSAHEGEEFILVLDGTVEIEYGKDVHTLLAGDSIYYDSIVPHQVRTPDSSAARILAVVYAPY